MINLSSIWVFFLIIWFGICILLDFGEHFSNNGNNPKYKIGPKGSQMFSDIDLSF